MSARFHYYQGLEGFWWRLSGANNRVLGISHEGFSSTAVAFADALEVKADLAAGRLRLGNTSGTNWQWQLSLGGVVRVKSITRYGRRIECLKGAERFRVALSLAEIPSAPIILNTRKSGPIYQEFS